MIDGSIGEGSPIHETFGYYAQGVWLDTATLPSGWQERLVEICNENTRRVTARCLEPHDLAVSKLVAGREKDIEFLIEMLRHGMIDAAVLLERVGALEISAEARPLTIERWNRIVIAAGRTSL